MGQTPPLEKERLSRLKQNGKVIPTENIVAALEAVIEPGNKVVLEGNNQKQADFLARSLCELNPDKVHDLHMIIPSMSLPEHLDVLKRHRQKVRFLLLRRTKPQNITAS